MQTCSDKACSAGSRSICSPSASSFRVPLGFDALFLTRHWAASVPALRLSDRKLVPARRPGSRPLRVWQRRRSRRGRRHGCVAHARAQPFAAQSLYAGFSRRMQPWPTPWLACPGRQRAMPLSFRMHSACTLAVAAVSLAPGPAASPKLDADTANHCATFLSTRLLCCLRAGISRDSLHKRRLTGGKQNKWRKKRK